MPGRIVLLVTSPRLPAGLLTAAAWDLVRSVPVHATADTADSPQGGALRAAGVDLRPVTGGPVEQADTLLDAATGTTVGWLSGPDGDDALARELGRRLAADPGRAELELMYGSWDPPGARLLDVVAVMDRLRTSCPWDAEQDHRTLAPYLLEEAYEAYDAIGSGDPHELREELGDVLLQVAFHARVAQDAPEPDRYGIDEVAADLVAKLVRRHPHVFAAVSVSGADEVHANWEQIKRAEKARRSATEGVALSQPALSLAAKYLSRAERAGVRAPAPPVPAELSAAAPAACADERTLGAGLLALVAAAHRAGLDPEAALRRAALAYADQIRAAESTGPADQRVAAPDLGT